MSINHLIMFVSMATLFVAIFVIGRPPVTNHVLTGLATFALIAVLGAMVLIAADAQEKHQC